MSADEQLDDLLDDWAELAERNPQVDLDAFIRDKATDLDDEARKRFRKRAAALARMNQRLDALQDTHSFPSDTSEPGNAPSLLGELKPGYEPLEGYKLIERLGRGGFGEVWKATDAQGFSVAIKFVPLSGKFGDKELQALEVMKDVRHPHLLSIVRVAPRDDVLVIAMELADRSLADRFEESRKEGYDGIPRNELLEYMAEAAKGIDYLNDPGSSGRPRIQHRDIKPANLLLSGNSVKIADYSLAQALTFNVAESIGSTPAYAAPEFFDGSTTSRSDQYSLAITYCHLRGGRLPFEGSLTDLMEAHRSAAPDLSMIPAEERPAVARALAKKPKDRWTSCAEFVSALKGNSQYQSVAGFLKALPSQVKVLAGSLASLLAVFLLLFAVGFFGGSNEEQPPKTVQRAAQTENQHDGDHELTVAVLDFANHSKDPTLEGYRLGFRDMLTTDLSKLSSIKVLERARLDALLKEHDLAKTDFIDADTAVRLRKGLSAHAMLSGSYVISGDDIRVDVRLVSVETGEVIQAEAVEGKKSDMFGLQKSLAAKVLSGLDIAPTEAEQEALNQPQTREFDAFRLYSEARLAQQQGKREEAKKRFNEALQLDPEFTLAARELDRLETEALFRLSESQQQKAKSAGEIGTRLQEHWNAHQRVVEQDRRDAEYFTSMLVLAAHAGLYGDFDQERQLLLSFWKRFSESVPPQKAVTVAQEMRKAVAKESEFFQKNVDAGYYGILVPGFGGGGMTPDTHYLKAELRGNFHWPKWSVIWPFDEGLRHAFQTVEKANVGELPIQLDSDWFDKQLPLHPHDYLKQVLDYGIALEDQRKSPERFIETIRLHLSVARFYSQLKTQPPESLTKDVHDLNGRLLRLLERVNVNQVDGTFLGEAVPVLEALAQTETDVERRERADQMLVRYVRQARINEGLPTEEGVGKGNPPTLYGLPLDGSPVVFVRCLGDITNIDMAKMRIEKGTNEAVGDFLRAMPSNVRFNLHWAGHVDEEKATPLFDEPQLADATSKQKGLAWLGQKEPGHIDETRPVGELVESLASKMNDKAILVLLLLDKSVRFKQETIDAISKLESCPRVVIVSRKQNDLLKHLAVVTKGGGVTLKAKGGFLGTDNIEADVWDLLPAEESR